MYELENILDFATEKSTGFTYQECKRLYVNFGLGKKLVNSLPKLSLASKREIYIDNAPDEVKDKYIKTCEKYAIDNIVLRATIISRIYGMSGVMILTDKLNDDYKALSKGDIQDNNIYFKVYDPLSFRVEINQDPLNIAYLEPSYAEVSGKNIDKSRFYTCFNGIPLYLDYQQSNFNFSGQSVFANMRRFIVSWVTLYKALENIAIKAGSILIKNQSGSDGSGGVFSKPQDIVVAQRAASLLKQLKQGMIGFLGKGQEAEFFNLNGASEVAQMIEVVRDGFASALEDTPSALLLDKNLSNGLSEGSEDMKAIVMAVNNYRENYINGIYNFLDSYMYYKAWDLNFIKEMKIKYPQEYATLGANQIREMWIKEFNFEWKSVYPKTPDEETKEKDGVLDRATKAKDLGISTEDLVNVINEANVFGVEVTADTYNDMFQDLDDTQDDSELGNGTKESF